MYVVKSELNKRGTKKKFESPTGVPPEYRGGGEGGALSTEHVTGVLHMNT